MTSRVAPCALAVSFLLAGSAQPLFPAPPPKTIIIAQPNSPVQITAYSARFASRSTYSREGINHDVAYLNRGRQKIGAIRFGLVSFDVFNRFLGKTGGLSMDDLEAGKSQKSSWAHSPYADFSFSTGLAYVDLVRLEDGTIWQADESVILEELRKIEKDFDAKRLKEDGAPRP